MTGQSTAPCLNNGTSTKSCQNFPWRLRKWRFHGFTNNSSHQHHSSKSILESWIPRNCTSSEFPKKISSKPKPVADLKKFHGLHTFQAPLRQVPMKVNLLAEFLLKTLLPAYFQLLFIASHITLSGQKQFVMTFSTQFYTQCPLNLHEKLVVLAADKQQFIFIIYGHLSDVWRQQNRCLQHAYITSFPKAMCSRYVWQLKMPRDIC